MSFLSTVATNVTVQYGRDYLNNTSMSKYRDSCSCRSPSIFQFDEWPDHPSDDITNDVTQENRQKTSYSNLIVYLHPENV
jgi:hypothetical protein